MPAIITNSELQRNPGKIAKDIGKKPRIVTIHGKPRMVLLPYFEENENLIEEYLEDYEMWKNQEKLQKKYKAASQSGASDLKI